MSTTIQLNENESSFELLSVNSKEVEFRMNGVIYKGILIFEEAHKLIIELNGKRHTLLKAQKGRTTFLNIDGRSVNILPQSSKRKTMESHEVGPQAPMPGKIFRILVEVGQEVSAGDSLIVMEAMKMEHTLKANITGIVTKIFFKIGEQVDHGELLVEIKEPKLNE